MDDTGSWFQVLGVAPSLPTSNMASSVAYYEKLGFTFATQWSDKPAEDQYAIARRDGFELHFVRVDRDRPHADATTVYLRVSQVKDVYNELVSLGMDQGARIVSLDYGLQIAHTDPDGNFLLFVEEHRAGRGITSWDTSVEGRTFSTVLAAFDHGDMGTINDLLNDSEWLADIRFEGRTVLHVFADAPGHRPNPEAVVTALVAAGADLNAHVTGRDYHETALHFAAANGDVPLIVALLDCGTDVDHPGSAVDGGPPASSALGYAQWDALKALYERGATVALKHLAALGDMEAVIDALDADPGPDGEEINRARWYADKAGQLDVARVLVERGATPAWSPPGS